MRDEFAEHRITQLEAEVKRLRHANAVLRDEMENPGPPGTATQLRESLIRFKRYVEAHESHAAWCNGGYPDEICTCDRQRRIAAVVEGSAL